jgi:8-oxo-dGTP pyrophosphatase MutT (NUDIX family)
VAGGKVRVSAGILLYRRVAGGSIELLLAHPGGPWDAHREMGVWSIPKGEAETGEELAAVARREFAEETGHPAPEPLIPLGEIVQRGGKVVLGWAAEGDLDPAAATSNLCEIEWPPGTGKRILIPEIDRVAWFSPAEARLRLKDRQVPFIDRLELHLATERARPEG